MSNVEPVSKRTANYKKLADAIVSAVNEISSALSWLSENEDIGGQNKEAVSVQLGALIVLCNDLTKAGMDHEKRKVDIALPDMIQMTALLVDVENFCLAVKNGGTIDDSKLRKPLASAGKMVGFGKLAAAS